VPNPNLTNRNFLIAVGDLLPAFEAMLAVDAQRAMVLHAITHGVSADKVSPRREEREVHRGEQQAAARTSTPATGRDDSATHRLRRC
jgi:hypothetical protein